MGTDRHLGRRTVPGTHRTASVFGLVVDPPWVAPAAADRQLIALLRKARGEGVTVFDVSGSAYPARAERLVAAAFPSFDPDLLVIAPATGPGSSSRDRPAHASTEPRDPRRDLARSLSEIRRHLAPQVPGILEWSPEGEVSDEKEVRRTALEDARASGEVVAWAQRMASDRPDFLEQLADQRPRLFFTGLSLLEADLFTRIGTMATTGGFGAFVRDPFSRGRLDGTRFASSVNEPGRPVAPVDVRGLREEFAPVLRLGFLSIAHRRTLAQASLQFLLSGAWVTSILLPVPRPERWEEVFGALTSEPLSKEDLRRLATPGAAE